MKAKNRITTKVRQDIRNLAEALGEIIPGSSLGSFSFEKIAEARQYTKKYWKKGKNKKENISSFLIDVYRYHPNLIFKIIRENLPKGIERRHKMGKPILKPEMEQLDRLLKNLNIDMTRELCGLNLPEERPQIVPPPPEYQNLMTKVSFEPDIEEKCKQLYLDGHINEAVRKALEIYEKKIQDLSNLELTGKDLMMQALNENHPLIQIADINTRRDKSLQEGFKFISSGVMLFWRNKFSHGDEDQISYIDGFQILLTVNQLIREINAL